MAAPAISNLSRTVALQYNAIGSILYKTDVGVYNYPASGASSVRPHAVTTVNGNTFGYDANGNTVSTTASQYRSITYTSFNLPDGQAGAVGPTNGPRYTWQYDANHQRVKEVHTDTSGTRTTWYVHPDNAGGLSYEYEVAANGTMTSRHYITAGEGVIAVLTTTGAYNSGTSMTIAKTEYWHRDHLGSTAVTTDGSGNVTQLYAYDPFGKRRYTDGNYDSQGMLVYDYPNGTSRGFTGHEQLDDIGMVNMNGRLYDPFTGRFLQADPYIQSPGNLQNYNRYSYLYNNPLNGTDPSGYFSLIGSLEHAWKSIWHSSVGKIAVVVAVTWLGQYELSQYLIANGASYTSLTEGINAAEGTPTEITGYQLSALGYVTVGAASGFAGSYVGSNGNFKAGIQGAVVGGAFGYAGTIGQPDSMGRYLAHAAAGCLSGDLQGGGCARGAASAVAGKWTTNATDGNFVATVVVGGTASVIGGGKFANGAESAAFGYILNYCSTPTKACALSWAKAGSQIIGGGPLLPVDHLYAQQDLGACWGGRRNSFGWNRW